MVLADRRAVLPGECRRWPGTPVAAVTTFGVARGGLRQGSPRIGVGHRTTTKMDRRTPGDRTVTDASLDGYEFTDREVREILKRAVEGGPSREVVKRDGISLSELKAIGAEVGISPARLEVAARSVVQRDGPRPVPLLGSPTVLNFERRVAGEFDPDDAPQILGAIRRIMGVQGEADEIRGSLEWSAKGELGERHVTMSAKDGVTTIRTSANLTNAAVLTFLPAGVLGVFASIGGLIAFAESGSIPGLVVVLTVLPILYPVLRRVLRGIGERETVKFQRVLEELETLTERSSTGAAAQDES